MVVCELTLVPIGTETTSVSKYVAGALDSIAAMKNITFALNPMGTVIEAPDLDTMYEAIKMMQ